MRIIIASPPKTGNVWLKCLLANIYQLKALENPPADENGLRQAVEAGWLEENSIFHQHFAPEPSFFELAESVQANLVTTIRNPYDTFVSLYFFVQNYPKQFQRAEDPLHVLVGKPIDHADVLEFIGKTQQGFGIHLAVAIKWMESGRSIMVRYEKLRTNPFNELKKITNQLGTVDDAVIRNAVQACSADNMRKEFEKQKLEKHIRKGVVGDWRNHLTESHLEIFRTAYPKWITRLGYEVA